MSHWKINTVALCLQPTQLSTPYSWSRVEKKHHLERLAGWIPPAKCPDVVAGGCLNNLCSQNISCHTVGQLWWRIVSEVIFNQKKKSLRSDEAQILVPWKHIPVGGDDAVLSAHGILSSTFSSIHFRDRVLILPNSNVWCYWQLWIVGDLCAEVEQFFLWCLNGWFSLPLSGIPSKWCQCSNCSTIIIDTVSSPSQKNV